MSQQFRFKIGEQYQTQEGNWVTVLGRTSTIGYECVQCSDGIYRYDRSTHSQDAGRVTGSNFDYSHPKNFKRLRLLEISLSLTREEASHLILALATSNVDADLREKVLDAVDAALLKG